LLDQFTNIMLLMLMAVAVVSGCLSCAAGVSQGCDRDFCHRHSQRPAGLPPRKPRRKSPGRPQKMASPSVRVQRDGRLQEVPSQDLVPGDIVLLEAGDQVAADGRLLEAANLQVRESALTGEAHGASKQAQITLAESTPPSRSQKPGVSGH
jgi:P-type Ca2+ transporter type 2C